MLFNSLVFLFIFLPLCLISYYLLPRALRNGVLLLFSLVFFAWGGVAYTLLLLVSMAINYFTALGIEAAVNRWRRRVLVVGIALNLGLLIWFKYAGFLGDNLNHILQLSGSNPLDVKQIALPVGISFYTFHGLSYITDVYRRSTPIQRNPVDMALYISLFPQLIAGPIIRYNQIAEQLGKRRFDYDKVVAGLQRFIIGLAKKVLVANNLALAADTLWGVQFNDMSQSTAWLAVICYTLQIYTDFSAYSDMAIGLAALFGFVFPENFNYPYIARNMKDFWSRWHISLSTWFRDYVYIPLGGNRGGVWQTYRNLFAVFLLTGFWHGASWNFVFWGLFHGVFLTLERIWPVKGERLVNRIFAHLYTALVFTMSWVPFRAETLSDTWAMYRRLFDFSVFNTHKYNDYIQASLFNRELLMVLLIAVLGAAGFWRWSGNRMEKLRGWRAGVWDIASLAFFTAIFWLCCMQIVAGSYSPFIYFRF
jgi:alginate O-acetyltransferase complex protein AlgI